MVLRGQMWAWNPRFDRLVRIYWGEIDLLLEVRRWLAGR